MSQDPNELSGVVDDTTEVYRIHIPNPNTEFVLGRDDRGYVGFHVRTDVQTENFFSWAGADVTDPGMELALGELDGGYKGFVARVGSGGAFIGAGGGYTNVSSFDQSVKALTGVTMSVANLQALTGFVENLYFPSGESYLKWGLSSVVGAVTVGLDVMYRNAGMVQSPGTVGIYGDGSVYIGGACSFCATGMLASVNGGVTGTFGGMLATTVGAGLITSVTGLKSATMSAWTTSVVANDKLTLAARGGRRKSGGGEVRVEGRTIVVGATQSDSGLGETGVARAAGVMDFKQASTETVRLGADAAVEVDVGRAATKGVAPTRMRLSKTDLRLDTKDAAVALGKHGGRMYADGSVVQVSTKGVTIAALASTSKETLQTALNTAEQAYERAVNAAQLKQRLTIGGINTLYAGTAGAAIAGVAEYLAKAGEPNAAKRTGVATAAGAVAGSLLALGVISIIKLRNSSQRAAEIEDAGKTRKTAHDDAIRDEAAAFNEGFDSLQTPKIEVKTDSIVLSVGENKITIDKDGIKLEGKQFKNSIPNQDHADDLQVLHGS